ncbi:MAG: hemolysin family protein [Alphaproteobacteria bacterium]
MTETPAANLPSEPAPAKNPPHSPGILSRYAATLKAALGATNEAELRANLEFALSGKPDSDIFTTSERFMLLNILHFSERRVEDAMVPRADIVAIDETVPLSELLTIFQEAGHSRIPVYHETLDDPRGMVHIKDLLALIIHRAKKKRKSTARKPTKSGTKNGNGRDLVEIDLGPVDLSRSIASTNLVRQVLYVPPSMLAVDLLLKMQSTRLHMAVVVDEYGGTEGLISIEDLVEEIVGDIDDEHDAHEGPLIRADGDSAFVAHARASVEDLEVFLGRRLLGPDDEDVETLGGLLFSLVGRVPGRGEIITHPKGIEFEVLDGDPRRIKRLRIMIGGGTSKAPQPKE